MTEARVKSVCKKEGIDIGVFNGKEFCLDHGRNEENVFICINLISTYFGGADLYFY